MMIDAESNKINHPKYKNFQNLYPPIAQSAMSIRTRGKGNVACITSNAQIRWRRIILNMRFRNVQDENKILQIRWGPCLKSYINPNGEIKALSFLKTSAG
jgi:hypothetical protein